MFVARECNGLSLNKNILPGSKLQNHLFRVLLRIRHYPIALVCDISDMYLQIRMPTVDRSYFRFLWRDLDVNQRLTVYEFEFLIF